MRAEANAAKMRKLMEQLGLRSRGPGRVYLTGGATAVLEGWRASSVDVDLKLDPEPEGAFDVIAALKDELDLNIELAAPDQFIPALQGWRERSRYIGTWGKVDFFHYDPYSQALAKIERGHTRDLADARELVRRNMVDLAELEQRFAEIRPELKRYPAIDAGAFESKVSQFVAAERKP
jgi:uncharacterized nucleotidyltransferase DUF6036